MDDNCKLAYAKGRLLHNVITTSVGMFGLHTFVQQQHSVMSDLVAGIRDNITSSQKVCHRLEQRILAQGQKHGTNEQ